MSDNPPPPPQASVHLPVELLSIIGFKLDSTGDRLRFRAVSKSWRSALPFRQPPWLLLPESEEEEISSASSIPPPRRLVSLGDQAVHRITLPEIHRARVVGSKDNWLITMHFDKTVRITDPFSRIQFRLPSHFKTVPQACEDSFSAEEFRDELVWKVVLSAPPKGDFDRDCVAMAIHDCNSLLATATPDDVWWTTVKISGSRDLKSYEVKDVVYYNEQFYAISGKGNLMVCSFGDGFGDGGRKKFPRLTFVSGSFFDKLSAERKHYLVEWCGELLMVVRFLNFYDRSMYRTNMFHVYKFDFENKKFEELSSLGEYSLFVGYNTSVAVLASDYLGLMRKNCIYFTDDCKAGYFMNENGHDMGVFDLEDNSITPHFKGMPTSCHSPPVWIMPG